MRIWNDFFQRENGFERKSVRQDLLGIESKRAIQYFNLNESRKTLLVLWKSWGKKNESIN
jgi:hypothetical protein